MDNGQDIHCSRYMRPRVGVGSSFLDNRLSKERNPWQAAVTHKIVILLNRIITKRVRGHQRSIQLQGEEQQVNVAEIEQRKPTPGPAE